MSYPSPHRLGTIFLSVTILLTHSLIAVETERRLELHGINGFDRWLGNGREMWHEFGPLDLSDVDGWSGEINDIGIRFQMNPPEHYPVAPIRIRIGWIRLEEGAL